ncbi:MAG: UDP-N-acetylmuramoyl-tripeptide--D-alanyl-D-alanine ligase [Chromatiales bacterium]|jgi:UDP-N-acetylmuramoyl-tripeptide--D-alanyl-D-alanine ligase|nr:UDP-N-acetylmuramoyl-tripeptide--D-alanyl-D-alanine ligase [Chromatiales bacterium]
MTTMTLAAVARATGGTLHGDDAPFESITSDSRTLTPGQLFFALSGERFDGADFVPAVAALGAAGAVVPRRLDIALPQVVVPNVRRALGDWGRAWRLRFAIPVVGVTGSNGKTTMKEMTGAILKARLGTRDDGWSNVLVTWGNLNNDVGVPLTVAWLRDWHRAAVIEMGASKQGDIRLLTSIACPRVGIITNAGPAHLEGFGGTIADVARGKGELFAGLDPTATAVINRDDAYYDYWRGVNQAGTVVTFGASPAADYRAVDVEAFTAPDGSPVLRFRLLTPQGELPLTLPMAGLHNAVNAAGAAAAAVAAGASLDDVRAGLGAMSNVAGRLKPVAGPHGSRLFDDAYNANPGSVAAAIEFLATQPGERWLALGQMAELGTDGPRLHREIGELARKRGIDRLYATGELTRHAAEGYGATARWFADIDGLVAAVTAELHGGVTLLAKGSRSARMDQLIAALDGTTDGAGGHA